MMDELERVTNSVYHGYFVDLYVRVSNEIAIRMYEGMGYTVYRRVVEYYSAGLGEIEEDAYGGFPWGVGGKEIGWVVLTGADMRKPMKRDRKQRSVRENGREFRVHPHDVW